MNMVKPAPTPEQTRKVGINKELRMRSELESIYTDFKGIYNAEKKDMPNAIYMDIQDAELVDAWRGRIVMKYPLREEGVFGDDAAVGREEQPETKTAEIYRGNCRKVISIPGYGTDKLDADHIKLYEQHKKDLADWNKEQEDLEIHQALLESHGGTLLHGSTSSDNGGPCARTFNPNIFIAGFGAYDARQPVYHYQPGTWAQRIATALAATPNGVGSILDSVAMDSLINYATKKRISQLDLPVTGGKGWILTVSEIQAGYIINPAWSEHNLGSRWVEAAALGDKIMNWRGVLGHYRNLLIVQDMRMPSVLRTTSATPTLVAGYVKHGGRDERVRFGTQSGEVAHDVAVLHGRGALYKWEPEKLHRIEDDEDYGKVEGVGTACVRGIGLPIFRYNINPGVNWAGFGEGGDSPSGTTHEQFSSVVALLGLPGEIPA